MASDVLISLVKDRPGIDKRLDIPGNPFHLPKLFVLKGRGKK